MRIFKLILVVLCIVIIGFSCQEVIELDLQRSQSQIVIEGFVTDQPGPYTVLISNSVDFYENNTFPPVNGATVSLSDDQGNFEFLTEVEPGKYQTSTLQGESGVTYTLTVVAGEQSYKASSTMVPSVIPLDSINFRYEEESIFYKEGYYTTAYFNDPAGVANYYRLNIFVNAEIYVFDFDGDLLQDDNFWLTDDKFTDGNIKEYQFRHTLDLGDTVRVELHNLNQSTFDYYRTVVDVIDGGGVAPSNPISNFKNEALGYFGAFSVTSQEKIIE